MIKLFEWRSKPSCRNTKTSSRITLSVRTVGQLHTWKGWSDVASN